MTIIAGTLIMLVLIIAIILYAVIYNRRITQQDNQHRLNIKDKELELLRAVINTQELERDKIAGNLHDEVGPLISTLKLKVSKHQRDLKNKKLLVEDLNEEREMIDTIIDSVRGVSHDLSPQFLLKFGLIKSIKNYIEGLENIEVNFSTNLVEDGLFEKQVTVNTYRVTMEIINNVLKHDQPSELNINIVKEGNLIVFQLAHNGIGISNKDFVRLAETGKGIGLDSIKSRIIILSADLNYENDDQAKITLTVPVQNGKEY